MTRLPKTSLILVTALAAGAMLPSSARACATCFGSNDSNLALGASVGIMFLLVVILSVLGGVAGFFVYLARRAAAGPGAESLTAVPPAQPVSDSTPS